MSCLQSIAIADGDGNGLPPIQLAWQDVQCPSFDTTQTPLKSLNSSSVIQTLPMDINGDGITDIVQLYQENEAIHAIAFLATVNAASGQISYTPQNDIKLGHYGPDRHILTGDVNGNGMCDLIIVYSNRNMLSIDVFLSTGTCFRKTPITTNTKDLWLGGDDSYTIDANGDGRIDLVQAFKDGSSGANLLSFNTYLSQFVEDTGSYPKKALPTCTQSLAPACNKYLWAIDVNGDGMVDMVLLWKDGNGLLNTTSFITKDDKTSGLQLFAPIIQKTQICRSARRIKFPCCLLMSMEMG